MLVSLQPNPQRGTTIFLAASKSLSEGKPQKPIILGVETGTLTKHTRQRKATRRQQNSAFGISTLGDPPEHSNPNPNFPRKKGRVAQLSLGYFELGALSSALSACPGPCAGSEARVGAGALRARLDEAMWTLPVAVFFLPPFFFPFSPQGGKKEYVSSGPPIWLKQ